MDLANEPVNRVMTARVTAIDLHAPAGEILQFFTHHAVHHLPVVDAGQVVGMLGSTDVLKIRALLPRDGAVEYLNHTLTIAQLMRQPALTVGERDSLDHAAAVMAKHGIHALPVVTQSGTLVGIITTTDIIDATLHHGAPTRATAVDPPATAGAAGESMPTLVRELAAAYARIERLETVARSATRYLRGGEDPRLHTELVRTLERLTAGEAAAASPVPL